MFKIINNLSQRVNATTRVQWAVAVACLGVWGITLSFQFVWDDFPTVAENASVHLWATLGSAFTHDFWALHDVPQASGYWRPLPTLLYVLAAHVGVSPFWFHLLNLSFHVGVCLWVVRLLNRATLHGAPLVFAALFFALHPLHAETVGFISALPDLSAAFFGLAGMDVLFSKKKPGWARIALGALLLTLALLSKESAVVFLILSIGWAGWLGRKGKPFSSLKIFAACGLFGIILYLWLHWKVTGGIGVRSLWGGRWDTHLGTVLRLLPYSFLLTWIPFGQTPTRPFGISTGVSDWAAWASLAAIFMLAIFLGRTKKPETDRLRIGFATFFFFWLPVSNLLPAEGLIAERYLYLPVFGTALLAGTLFEQLQSRSIRIRTISEALPILWMVIWAILAVRSVMPWKNQESLWRHAIAASPGSSVAWNEWGRVNLEAEKLDVAKSAFAKALELQPGHMEARLNFSIVNLRLGDLEEADRDVRGHLKLHPDDPRGWDLMATIALKRADIEGAVAAADRAAELAPDNWKYRFNLADVLLKQKDYESAIGELEAARDLAPHRPEIWMNLAAGQFYLGEYREAVRLYRYVVGHWPKYPQAQENLSVAQKLLDVEEGKP